MSTRFRSTKLSPIPRLLGWLGLILMCCFTSAVFAGQVTLAWDASAGATGYRVYQQGTDETSVALSATHVTSSSPVVATVTSTTATVGNLVEGKTYYFAVKAYDNTSESSFSNETGETVPVVAPAPSANFSADQTSGTAPLTVKFTDSSTNATSWSWNFGDNTTSTAQNPSKTYSSVGTYTVSLTATGTGGSNTLTKTNYITVTAPSVAAPVASFATKPADGTGTAPLMVTFTDTSTGSIANRVWDFGDGTSSTSTTAQTTMKTYAAGSYIVKLTVSNSGGSNTMTKTISTTTAAPVVDFSATPTSGPAPLTVSFANGSSGDIESWSWSFGDGGTSTVQNPSHAYDKEGTYTVSLTATSSTGTKVTKTLAGYVTVSPANTNTGGLVAAYNFNETSGTTVVDASGNGNDGVISGATPITSGKFGGALSFDGVNDWVTVNDSNSLDLTTGMTLEAWVYPTSNGNWRTIIMKEQPNNLIYYLGANDINQPVAIVGYYDQPEAYDPTQMMNTWQYLAATYDGQYLSLYVNGVQVATRTKTGAMINSNGKLSIGGDGVWGEFFKGYIDEVRIYNRALTVSEIQADMKNPVTDAPADATAPTDGSILEVGEIDVGSDWRTVTFKKSFNDPVVVANPLDFQTAEPGVIRIRNVNATGFEIRSQAWDYLGGSSIAGKAGYLAMERGSHTLDDGTQIEAGRVDTSLTGSFGKVTFAKSFSVAPVVITGVASVNEESAVVTRVKSVTGTSFYVGMQEEEANPKQHATETIAYIAWQPSSGTVEGMDFQVGNTANIVTDKFYTLAYPKATTALPMFLADMQTTNGGDTANLRWQNKSQSSVEVKVTEEQSKGSETRHTKEVVGYILLTPKQ